MFNRRNFIKTVAGGIAAIPFLSSPALAMLNNSSQQQQKQEANQLHFVIKGPDFDNSYLKIYGNGVVPEVDEGIRTNCSDFVSIGDGREEDLSIEGITSTLTQTLEDPKNAGKEIILHNCTHGDMDKQTGKHGIALTKDQHAGKEPLTPTADYLKAIDGIMVLHNQPTKMFMSSCFGNNAQTDAAEFLSPKSQLVTVSDTGFEKLSGVDIYRELQTGNYIGKELGPKEIAVAACIADANKDCIYDHFHLQIKDEKGNSTITNFQALTEASAQKGSPETEAMVDELLYPIFGDNLEYLKDAAENTDHSKLPSFYQTKLPLVGAIRTGNTPIIQAIRNVTPDIPRDDIINNPEWDQYNPPTIVRDDEGKHSIVLEKVVGKNKGQTTSFKIPDLNEATAQKNSFNVSEKGDTITKYTYRENVKTYDFKKRTESKVNLGKITATNDDMIVSGVLKSNKNVSFDILEKSSGKIYSIEGNIGDKTLNNHFAGPISFEQKEPNNHDITTTELHPRMFPLDDYDDPTSNMMMKSLLKKDVKLQVQAQKMGLIEKQQSATPAPKPELLTQKPGDDNISRREFLTMFRNREQC